MQFRYDKPDNWLLITPQEFGELASHKTGPINCVLGFLVSDSVSRLVSVLDYGDAELALDSLKHQMDKLSNDNGDVSELVALTKTTDLDSGLSEINASLNSLVPLFYEEIEMVGKNCYVCVLEIDTSIGKGYSLQIFFEMHNTLFCLNTSVNEKISKEHPFSYMLEHYPYVKDMVLVFLKSLEEEL